MAGFEGTVWAPGQYRYTLRDGSTEMLPTEAMTHAVSRSVHYGLCLVFEGIRFFVQEEAGRLNVVFVNLPLNIERFRAGISFNLSDAQQGQLPTAPQMLEVFLGYLRHPKMRGFLTEMARDGSQGYLRPFTVDDDQSIGVTFAANPVIRVVSAHYRSYLGEPFHGVAIPWLVRAVGANGTGCLKLGGNYLLSVRAVQEAQRIRPGASTALFLDDRPYGVLRDRTISEWDSSACMIGLRDGTVIRIPDSPLILPSVTVRGITGVLREMGVTVDERDVTYGELVDRARAGEIATVASLGTAGILNRVSSLLLLGDDREALAQIESDTQHEVFERLGAARQTYWDVYRGRVSPPEGLERFVYDVGAAN
jgi:branched-subunit amino acid aminotransferase/4-amino-4-deoxychorismate lyase